ncbi:restriction endonuclease subunit S [Litoribacillus peritrichatus]|uniref:Type I restriction modification DNA specificity domain-containing protein n=1 Tax=Litoribacillus peritrichatus TaxID=718191 RepID=A0ABP7MXE1_9GAMM
MIADTDTLESMCELVIDCPHFTPKWTDSGYIVLRNQNIKNGVLDLSSPSFTNKEDFKRRNKRATPKAGDIVFTREAPMGEVCMIPDGLECCLGQRQVLLRPKNDVCGQYLFWALQSPFVQHQISWNEGTGSTVSNVRIPVLKALNIPRHPKKEDEIAKLLSDLADKIELNRQTNQTLENIAQAIFKSWFVDFEPTRAKVAARENGQDLELAAMAAIACKEVDELDALSGDQLERLKSIAELFPDRFEDSELGEIPIGWRTENLSDEIDILNGFAFKSKDYSEKGTFVLRTKNFNVSNETERLHDDVFLPESFLISHEKYMAKPFDYHLIMVGASVGNRGIIYPCHLPALRNQNMWCFRAKRNSFVSQVYTKYLLDFLVVKSVGLASGSAREFFRKGDFGSQKICIGSEEIQAAFYRVVMPIFEKKASLVEENQILETLRNSLLPKLLSGEIDLVEQEKAVVNG